jgi:hypothetical protein
MLTKAQVDYLLQLPKVFNDKDPTIDLVKEKNRLNLISPDDNEWKFLVEITSNKKISFKISLHCQEDNTKIGLLRIDYKGSHKNPEIENTFVPEFLKPYTAMIFYNEAHIHIFVDEYRNLDWAIPLKNYGGFLILEINSKNDLISAIEAFAEKINIISKLTIQESLI